MSPCPCGSGLVYDECCGPVIEGSRPSLSPESLMRARYCAFLEGNLDFLEQTLAPEKRAAFDRTEVNQSSVKATALGIEILATSGGGEDEDTGSLDYVARFKMQGDPYLHHERATFRRENGAWVYVDGLVNPKSPPRTVMKIGRNDPCPCGSGRKYKICCGG